MPLYMHVKQSGPDLENKIILYSVYVFIKKNHERSDRMWLL